MATPALLGDADEGRWLSLITPEVAGIADAAAFGTWRKQIVNMVRMGVLEAWAALDAPDGPVGTLLLVQSNGGSRQVMLGAGDLSTATLGDLMNAVAERSQAVFWGGEVGPDWADRLAPRGFETFVHTGFVCRLAKVEALRVPFEPDPAIVAWDPAWRGDAVRLITEACAHNLVGLTLVLPAAPTRAMVAAHVDALLGPGGTLMAEATSLHVVDGQLRGIILIIRSPEGPLVHFVGVDPAGRGGGVAKRMLLRSQHALVAAGEVDLHFWTTEANAPVHRMYEPQAIEALPPRPCGYWLRPGV